VRIDSRADLIAYAAAQPAGDLFPILAQDYLPGQDIDLSVLCDDGEIVAWTIQESVPGESRSLRFLRNQAVLDMGSQLVRAIGFHGIAHFDLRHDERDGSIRFIECNPRFWGSVQYSAWAGVNFPDLGVRMAVGETPEWVVSAHETVCHNPGLAPRRLLRDLVRGRADSPALNPATHAAYTSALSDPLPAIAAWLQRQWDGAARVRPGSEPRADVHPGAGSGPPATDGRRRADVAAGAAGEAGEAG
jgi:hypothetical protein